MCFSPQGLARDYPEATRGRQFSISKKFRNVEVIERDISRLSYTSQNEGLTGKEIRDILYRLILLGKDPKNGNEQKTFLFSYKGINT